MAKLTPGLGFIGAIGNYSSYRMKGCEGVILRSKGGPSRSQVKNSETFVNTRKNNQEFGGRSKAAAWVARGLQPLKPLADYNFAGPLQALLKAVQLEDSENALGERHIQLSRQPRLLSGFSLNRQYLFDSVLRSPLPGTVSREHLSAEVALPQLVPGINFFPPPRPVLFSLVAALAVVPDLFCTPRGYAPHSDYESFYPLTASTSWHLTTVGCPAEKLSLSINTPPPDSFFSLILSVGIRYGIMVSGGEVQQELYSGSAKVLVAG